MKQKKILLLSFLVWLWCGIVNAQTNQPVTPEQRKQANEFYQVKNWEKSVEAYEAITQAEPNNNGALFRLGSSYYQLKKYREAISAFERAEKINSNQVITWNLGTLYSVLNDIEKSAFWLDKAISVGFNNLNLFQTDADLANLRQSPKYKVLEEKLIKASAPCQYDEPARQFDFWVGDWEVKDKQGKIVGKNTIQKLEKGCLLYESWTSADGGTGKSFNFYDREIKKWRQVYVDDFGNSTLFIGEFKDGSMRYEAEKTGADGKKYLSKLTFTPLDKTQVRQYGEYSNDGGKTWVITFDYVYSLKHQ